MNKCRVVVTKQCNLSCPFCCMEDEDMVNTFLPRGYEDGFSDGFDEGDMCSM